MSPGLRETIIVIVRMYHQARTHNTSEYRAAANAGTSAVSED